MTKKIHLLSIVAIAAVLIAGSLAVSPIAIAGDDDDDDGGGTQTLLCPEGEFMIGIVTDDDDDGGGVIDLICEAPNGVPPSQPGPGFLNCTCDGDIQPVAICLEDCEASAVETCTEICANNNANFVKASCETAKICEAQQ